MAVNIRLNFWLIYDDFGISSVIWLVRIINDNLVRNDVLSWCIIPEFARTEERRPRESQIDRCLCRDFNLWPPQYETRVHHFCTPCILTCDFHNTRQECITFYTPFVLTCDLQNTRRECITFCTPCILTCDLHNTRQQCITFCTTCILTCDLHNTREECINFAHPVF